MQIAKINTQINLNLFRFLPIKNTKHSHFSRKTLQTFQQFLTKYHETFCWSNLHMRTSDCLSSRPLLLPAGAGGRHGEHRHLPHLVLPLGPDLARDDEPTPPQQQQQQVDQQQPPTCTGSQVNDVTLEGL